MRADFSHPEIAPLREAKEFVEWLWANPYDGLLPS
jgi:hypothetical protein